MALTSHFSGWKPCGHCRKEFEPLPIFRCRWTSSQTRPPVPYQQIAERAALLRDLGMSNRAIARSLPVSHWLVARAIAWFEGG